PERRGLPRLPLLRLGKRQREPADRVLPHQCATAAAPCSSISAPLVNRSSLYGRASSLSPVASTSAKAHPLPGVALKPPVPQPQLRNRPGIGVGQTIGDASGQTSTIPAQVRSSDAWANIGKSSSAAAIWCSITWKDPRCAYPLYGSIPAPITSSPLSACETYTCTAFDMTTQPRTRSYSAETSAWSGWDCSGRRSPTIEARTLV